MKVEKFIEEDNYILCKLPFYDYDIEGIQRYLKEKASQGLFVIDLDKTTTYQRGEPEDVTYYLIAKKKSNEDYPSEKEKNHYKELGLEYVCNFIKEFDVVKKAAADNVENLNLQQYIEKQFHYVKKRLWLSLILFIIVLFSVILIWLIKNKNIAQMSTSSNGIIKIVLMIVLCISLVSYLRLVIRDLKYLYKKYNKEQLKKLQKNKHYYSSNRYFFWLECFIFVYYFIGCFLN